MWNTKNALIWLEDLLWKIEWDIKRSRLLIKQINEWNFDIKDSKSIWKINDMASNLLNYQENEEIKVVEWIYDGYFMTWSDEKKYPVPMNYSSKTKLIPWDVLKLRIMEDWKLIYKLIESAPKQYIKATLSKTDDNKYIAISDEWKNYMLNQAAVSYFKWMVWDELSIIINWEWFWSYAAIEALISKM